MITVPLVIMITLSILSSIALALALALWFRDNTPKPVRQPISARRKPILVVAGDFHQFQWFCEEHKLRYHMVGTSGDAIYIRQPYMLQGWDRGTPCVFIGTFWEHGDLDALLQICRVKGYKTNLPYTSIWGPQ